MENLFTKLPITIQQATKTKSLDVQKEEFLFAVKKYNAKKHRRIIFYKPISKIILI